MKWAGIRLFREPHAVLRHGLKAGGPLDEGQLNSAERGLLMDSILKAPRKPKVVIEVGTWLGEGARLRFCGLFIKMVSVIFGASRPIARSMTV